MLSDHHSNNICRKLSNIHVSYLHTIPQISKACKKASDFCFTHGGSPAQRSWVTCLRPFSLWLAEFELFGGTRKHSANTEKYWKATSGMWASMTFSARVLDTARPERWRWDVQGPFFERGCGVPIPGSHVGSLGVQLSILQASLGIDFSFAGWAAAPLLIPIFKAAQAQPMFSNCIPPPPAVRLLLLSSAGCFHTQLLWGRAGGSCKLVCDTLSSHISLLCGPPKPFPT